MLYYSAVDIGVGDNFCCVLCIHDELLPSVGIDWVHVLSAKVLGDLSGGEFGLANVPEVPRHVYCFTCKQEK